MVTRFGLTPTHGGVAMNSGGAPGSGNDLAGTDRMARVLGRYQTQLIEPDVTRAEALQLVL